MKTLYDIEMSYKENWLYVGFENDEYLKGYIKFRFEFDEKKEQILNVVEIIYDDRNTMMDLISFIKSLTDQVEKISIETNERYFHTLFSNPSNGLKTIPLHHQVNVEEIGIMYRIINIKEYFKNISRRKIGDLSTTIRFNIRDSFYNDNNLSITIKLDKGIMSISNENEYETDVTMDISEFSSLAVGTVPFNVLYQYNKADINNIDKIPEIDEIFKSSVEPFCHTRF